jgi:ERCC4-type nuclease
VTDVEDVAALAEEDALSDIKGIGAKTQDAIQRALADQDS